MYSSPPAPQEPRTGRATYDHAVTDPLAERPVDSAAPPWFHRLRERRRYEFLLVALLLHLFVAVLLPDVTFYARVVWPLTMVVLGVFSVSVPAV